MKFPKWKLIKLISQIARGDLTKIDDLIFLILEYKVSKTENTEDDEKLAAVKALLGYEE